MAKGSKVNRKGRNHGAKHVRLYWHLLDSEAYRHASPVARCLLVELEYRFTGQNNGTITLSVREAVDRLGCGKNQAAAAFHDLEHLGFIRCHQRGAFTNKRKLASEWILTEHPFKDQKATKDYMRWELDENLNHGPRRRDRGSPEKGPRPLGIGITNSSRSPEKGPSGEKSPIHGPRRRDTYSLPG